MPRTSLARTCKLGGQVVLIDLVPILDYVLLILTFLDLSMSRGGGGGGGRLSTANSMMFRSRPRHAAELPHILFYGYALLALFLHCSDFVSAQSVTGFSVSSFNSSDISCIGSATLTLTKPQAICLTPSNTSADAIFGRCFYVEPIQFPSSTSDSRSFSTMFSFTTLTYPQFTAGQGFTFYIGPDNTSTGGANGYLGWLNSTTDGNESGHNFALEFDLTQNLSFNDPSYTHVGINVNSMKSNFSAPFDSLTTYSTIQKSYAWIDYDGQMKTIEVRLSQDPNKPCKLLLSRPLDLTNILLDTMYVGFSSSSGGETNAQTTVWDWSFNADGKAGNIFSGNARCGFMMSTLEIVAVVLGVTVLLMILLLFLGLTILHRKKRKISALENEKSELVAELKHMSFGAREFSYRDLSEATEEFKHQIGIGGFGTVFKGDLSCIRSRRYSKGDETIVAVKKIKRTSDSAEDAKQLVAEVKVIGRLKHNNIVPLLGWCYDRGEMLLVYKYMENGDVDMHLFPSDYGTPEVKVLSWDQRMRTLKGVAAALLFLHDEFEFLKSVVHRDIKTRNIMVDHYFNARLGDFGLAQLYDRSRKASYPDNEVLMGTRGYIAPEYLEMGATVETDVYSFGVFALVVATGRKPIPDQTIPEGLVKWMRRIYDKGAIEESRDVQLVNDETFNLEEMERVMRVGLSCCLYKPADRPSMSEVLTALKGIPSMLSTSLPPDIPEQEWASMAIIIEDDSKGSQLTTSELTSTSEFLSTSESFPAESVTTYLAKRPSSRTIDVDR